MTVLSHVNAPSAASPVATAGSREGILKLDSELALHFGGSLQSVDIAWRLVGPPGAPIVVALGGISAGRYVTASEDAKGWWTSIVGDGRALDTQRFQVLGMDFLGGSGVTTGPKSGDPESGNPKSGNPFPAISAYDQAEVLSRLLRHLNVSQLRAIVGASYGGMVALAFAQRFGTLVEDIIVISAADRSHPMSTAWRSVQRSIVRYALAKQDGAEGLRLARALAMATYRSSQEFSERFSGPPALIDGRFYFPVEQYLLARGDAYATSYQPEAFVCLSESIDLHQVDATSIEVPTTLIAVREDQLVPLADMRALRDRMGTRARLIEISSLYGHDAFLKEAEELRDAFAPVLNAGANR